jgi:hypothetical protein
MSVQLNFINIHTEDSESRLCNIENVRMHVPRYAVQYFRPSNVLKCA